MSLPRDRRQIIWALTLVWLAVLGSGVAAGAEPTTQGTTSMLTDMITGKYRVGQIWKFRSRPGEQAATMTVVKVESSPGLGVIVHVSLQGLHIKSPLAPGGFTDVVQHAPFSEEAITKSVTKLAGQAKVLPAFEEGYREWRKAFDAGKGGVFTVTAAEVVEIMETAIQRANER